VHWRCLVVYQLLGSQETKSSGQSFFDPLRRTIATDARMKRVLRRWLSLLIPPTWRLPLAFHRNRLKQWRGELEQLRRWSSPDATAIDVGANEGLYSYKFAQWFGKVEAFEPNPSASKSLRDYRSPRIRIHEIALSASIGRGSLHVPVSPGGREEVGWGTLDPKEFKASQEIRATPVPMTTLDTFNFERVHVIKIDVEGHECEVLAGAIDTIHRCRPILLLEVKSSSRRFVTEYFQTLGYIFYFWDSTRLIELKDGIAAWDNSRDNLFVIPKEKAGSLTAVAGKARA
jgi:FkbM family methyltransferase